MDIQLHKANGSPNKLNLKRASLRCIIINLSKIKERENLKSSKRTDICNLQGNPHKSVSGFLSRNLMGEDRMG